MLKNRIVAVVGGSTGIGRATAIACGRAGATVVVGARKVEQAQAVADEAVVAGAPAALALAVDVRASASVDAFVAKGVAAFGRIDGAVNNAGVAGRMCALPDAGDEIGRALCRARECEDV